MRVYNDEMNAISEEEDSEFNDSNKRKKKRRGDKDRTLKSSSHSIKKEQSSRDNSPNKITDRSKRKLSIR